MATLSEIPILNEPRQYFSMAINGQKVSFYLAYNTVTARYSMTLSIDENPVVTGIRMVSNIDLIAAYDLGLGMLFVAGVKSVDAEPTMEAFAANLVKLYSYV